MQNSKKKLKKKSEIQLFNRKNVLAIFDEKIEIRERFQNGAKECTSPRWLPPATAEIIAVSPRV